MTSGRHAGNGAGEIRTEDLKLKKTMALRIGLLALAVFVAPGTAMCAGGGAGANAGASGGEAAKEPAKTDSTVAAQVGSDKITMDDLDKELHKTNAQAFQAFYDARRAALDQMIAERLMNEEAEARKTTAEALTKEIVDGAGGVEDSEVEAFYNQNKGQMGGRTLDQLREQIRAYLVQLKGQQAVNAFLDELKAKKKVKILLEPPRAEVAIRDKDPSHGPEKAPVQIVEFSDFQCPFCARAIGTIKQVQQTYGDKVRLVFRDFPLSIHQNAQSAAEAANCANEQGKFWEYHDKLFANQHALGGDQLKQYAKDLGMDSAKFDACFDSSKYDADVQQDMSEGSDLGVSGTPAFFINGRFVSGAQPFEVFKNIIDEELERKGAAK